MENFKEMLEDYLDENEINSKKKIDSEEIIKKKIILNININLKTQ